MVSKHNSVTAILKRELPDLIFVKTHSLHLCAEKAAESIPRQLEFLERETHNWFSYSPKCLDYYRTLYGTMNTDPKKSKDLAELAGSLVIKLLTRYWSRGRN